MISFKGGVRDGRLGEGCLSVFVLIALFSVRLSSVRLSSVPGVLPSTQAICVSHAQKIPDLMRGRVWKFSKDDLCLNQFRLARNRVFRFGPRAFDIEILRE